MRPSRLRGRGYTYAFLLGSVTSILVVGLAVPFVFGSPVGGRSSTLGGARVGESAVGLDPVDLTAPAPETGSGGPSGFRSGTTGGTASGETGSGRASLAPGVGNGGATDQGVTSDTIRVAVFILDLAGLGDAGFGVALGDQRPAYDAYFAELNERGGIYGRKVAYRYFSYDPLDEDDMRRACVEATEEYKPFAALDFVGLYGAAPLCVTQEHGVPFIGYNSEPDEWYERANGLFFTLGVSKSRILRSLVAVLDTNGLLRSKKIGVLDSAYPSDKLPSDTSLMPELARRGYKVTHRATLSGDFAEAQAQIPIEVQNMQSKGVDSVIMVTNYVISALFVQQAEKRGFLPQYFHSDFASGSADETTQQMPASYDGAIALTGGRTGEKRVGIPQPAVEADCERRFESRSDVDIRYEDPTDENYFYVQICSMVDAFAYGMEVVGPRPTRRLLSSVLQQRGPFAASGLLGDSWRPGKFSSTDQGRLLRWHYERGGSECRCWIPINKPQPLPY